MEDFWWPIVGISLWLLSIGILVLPHVMDRYRQRKRMERWWSQYMSDRQKR